MHKSLQSGYNSKMCILIILTMTAFYDCDYDCYGFLKKSIVFDVYGIEPGN